MFQEKAPELFREGSIADDKSDVWSLGATILQFLMDQKLWDSHALIKQFGSRDTMAAIQQATELQTEPSIIKVVRGANPKIQFLTDCLQYNESDRPSAMILSRRLQQSLLESNAS